MNGTRVVITDALREEIISRKLGDEKISQTTRRLIRAGLKVVKQVEEAA